MISLRILYRGRGAYLVDMVLQRQLKAKGKLFLPTWKNPSNFNPFHSNKFPSSIVIVGVRGPGVYIGPWTLAKDFKWSDDR